jgi:anti-sigma factor RsiW
MTRACSTTEELVLLIDGELTENRSALVRSHVEACAACRAETEALRALVRDVAHPIAPRPDAVARLLARLDDAPPVAAKTPWKWSPSAAVAGALAGAVALAAALAVVLGLRMTDHAGVSHELTARGGPTVPSLERDVGVTVYRRGSNRLDALAAGEEVGPDAAYAVAYRNLGTSGSAYAMVFAQDASLDLHWIAPAWVDSSLDPASESLAHAETEAPPTEAIALDRPAGGPLHVFTLVTSRPLRVSDIERIGNRALEPATLRARWPDAVVDETVVRVASGEVDGGSAR